MATGAGACTTGAAVGGGGAALPDAPEAPEVLGLPDVPDVAGVLGLPVLFAPPESCTTAGTAVCTIVIAWVATAGTVVANVGAVVGDDAAVLVA